MVLAPEHPLVATLTAAERRAEVETYVGAARRETEIDRLNAEREKSGVFIGAYAVNPLTNERIPIWIADYVLPAYGTGAIMAVPAHDERDYAFARKYELPIRYVVAPASGEPPDGEAFMAHTADEVLVDSGEFTGMPAAEAIAAITQQLSDTGLGAPAVTYRLRDWLVSRQRYWGAPIPVVYCEEHGAQLVPEEELPVLLPADVDFAPTGVSPLASHAEFLSATCPVDGGPARRETDTMDTFVDSAWYFLRYTSPHDDRAWDPEKAKLWMPVNMYTGGAEHAVLHLMYSRFFVKALRDMGMLTFDEPFLALRNQGQILGADHHRMSKSRGNVVNPDDLVARYGTDAVRLFLMFIGPWDQGGPWSTTGIDGVYRFLGRVWHLSQSDRDASGHGDAVTTSAAERTLRRITHQTIAAVGDDYEGFRFNTGIAKLMELANALADAREGGIGQSDAYAQAIDTLLLLLAPVAPHITEELWERRGKPYSVHQQPWPVADPALAAADTIELPIQVDGKLRDRLLVASGTAADEIERLALASERVQAHLGGRAPRRVIQIPGKLVNVVTPSD
jgi:leucyl-tRNA synthetase